MKLSALNFDNGNNAALSLREVAEKVRTGEMQVKLFDVDHEAGRFRIDLTFKPEPQK